MRAFDPHIRRRPILQIDDLLIRPQFDRACLTLDIADQSFGIWRRVVAEGNDRPLGSRIDLLDAGNPAELFDRHYFQQVLDLLRQGPESVDHLRRERFDFLLADEQRQPAIQAEAHRQVGDITLRNEHRCAERNLRRPRLFLDFAAIAQSGDGLLQHVLIKLHPHFADMAGLLVAEQIARAANVQIVTGERETRPQRIQRLHYLKPPQRRRRDRLARRQGQIGIGAHLRTPDTPAQLIELRQAEPVRPVDDDRICLGNIETRLHDMCAQQNIVSAFDKSVHDLFERRHRHLAVRHGHPGVRHQLADPPLDMIKIGDTGANVEYLPAAKTLALDRFPHDDGIIRQDKRPNREPVDRRRRNDAHLPNAGERHLQSPRDRRRGQRQNMHIGSQLLQPFLLRHAEMLLLVDDQQAQLPELDRLRE